MKKQESVYQTRLTRISNLLQKSMFFSFNFPAVLHKKSRLLFFVLVSTLLSSLLMVSWEYEAGAQEQAEQQQLPRVYVAGAQAATSSINVIIPASSAPHEMPLKGIKKADGEITMNENFKVEETNILAVPFGQNINILSDSINPRFSVSGAKISTSIQEQQPQQDTSQFNLNRIPANTNMFSLAGHQPGVYILDVILESGNVQGAYETLLQIVPQDVGEKKTIEKRTAELIVTISVTEEQDPSEQCLFNPELEECEPDEEGNCPPGWAMNEDSRCYPSHKKCPPGYWRADDDETGACVPLQEEEEDEAEINKVSCDDLEGSGRCYDGDDFDDNDRDGDGILNEYDKDEPEYEEKESESETETKDDITEEQEDNDESNEKDDEVEQSEDSDSETEQESNTEEASEEQ
jgi:hypothetical protein